MTSKPNYRYSWEYRAWVPWPRIRKVDTAVAVAELERCVLRGLI